MLAFTGAYISFPQTMKTAVAPLVGEAAPKAGPAPGGPRGRARPLAETRLTADQAVARAVRSSPSGHARVVRLGWPTEKSADWTVRLAGAALDVKVDDRSGAVFVDPPRGGTDGVARLMRRIHYGTDTGPVRRTLIFLGGIAPAILGVTGVIMWLRNRAGRRAVEAARRGR